mgnify:CR=1 FL=1
MVKKYLLYLGRWQLSTPILYACMIYLPVPKYIPYQEIVTTVIANLIGGLIFFWVDKWIFRKNRRRGNERVNIH